MRTETKKTGLFEVLKSIFIYEDEIEEDYEKGVTLPKELLETKAKIEMKAKKVTQGFNSGKGVVKRNNNVFEKFNPETIKDMRGKHQEVISAQQAKKHEDVEIGD